MNSGYCSDGSRRPPARSARIRRSHPLRQGTARRRVAALSAGRHRLRRRSRPRRAGRRHGAGQDDSGHRRRRAAGPTGRHPPRAGRLPRVAQEPVAQRNQPFLRSDQPSRSGQRRGTRPTVRERHVLYDLQLRASAARPRDDRTRGLGPDHSGRRPADQELGIQDVAADQEPQVTFRAGPVRHAVGESSGRTLHGRHALSTTGGWVRPIASCTGTAWSTSGAGSRAIATWTSCAKRSSPSCCAARAAA